MIDRKSLFPLVQQRRLIILVLHQMWSNVATSYFKSIDTVKANQESFVWKKMPYPNLKD